MLCLQLFLYEWAAMHQPHLPTGTVTFLFTDIEGSTQLWERYPEQARPALARHDALIEAIVEQHGGSLVRPRGEGDSRFAVFSRATDAVAAAAAMQRALYDEPWSTPTPLRVRAALHTGEADLRDGDYYGSAVNRCARLRSAAHGGQTLLSRATYELVREGRPEGVDLQDLGEHQLKDLQQPEHIFQLVVAGIPSDFPSLKTLDARPNNLPSQRSPLVGREAEVAAIQRLLLRDNVGLLTLTGPGGIGKTRLALQVAAEMIDFFADGVYFVSLAAVSNISLVAPTIAEALGVKQVPSHDMVDALANFLSDKRLLLVLDNFEQVVAAGPLVSKLLLAAPRLKVLVTSREVLHVRDEQDFAVPPLGVPDLRHLPPAEALSQYEAVSLFIQRARLVNADFQITNENAPAVAEICSRLDGLPLAIELAAARIRLLSPQAMLSRLASKLSLLTSGARDMPERQQTLRGAIQWSYDLLQPGEQRLFRRMSVFVGGATLEAIEAICNADGALEVDVFDGAASLVDKSLVKQETGTSTDNEPRFGMLQTIHEYAMELLQTIDPAEGVEMYRQHTQYYLALGEQGAQGIRGPQQDIWLDRLNTEHDNLQAVMKRAIDQGDSLTALTLGGALWMFWGFRNYFNEGKKWLKEVLRLPGAEVRNHARARALLGAALMYEYEFDSVAAYAYGSESIAIFRELGSDYWQDLGLALLIHGVGLAFSEDPAPGRAEMEEGLALFRQHDYKWGLSFGLFMQGFDALMRQEFASALPAFEESMLLARQTGNKWVLAQVLNSLGDLSRITGEYDRAKDLYEEGLTLLRRLNTRSDIPAALHNLGHVALAQGRLEDARKLFIEALRQQLTLKNKLGVAECLAGLAGVAGAEKRPERAGQLFGAAEAAREHVTEDLMWPAEQVDYERNLAAARVQMDEAAWEAEWKKGRAMTLEQAVNFALEGGNDG